MYFTKNYLFFVRESNVNSVVDTLSSSCDPLTYLGVRLQSRLQLLWLCAVSKGHIKANFSGNSLKIAVRSLRVKGEKKRADIPRCTSSFKKQPLCARTWCCIIIYPLKWQRAASPPYTSSMQTMPSPAFSRWVIVTVAASPEARARPANSEEQENAAVGTHRAPVEHTAIISVVTLTILCTIQSSHSFLQTVPRRVATAAVFKALKNYIKY